MSETQWVQNRLQAQSSVRDEYFINMAYINSKYVIACKYIIYHSMHKKKQPFL